MSDKCLVYEDYLNDIIVGHCPKSNLTGYCRDVSNVAADLAEVPPQTEILCLDFRKDSSLDPDSFSRFQKLINLQIYGAISAIHPGAFKHLSSLQSLQIWCSGAEFFLSSEVLSDLQNVTSLNFISCRLSSMAVDVFRGIRKLERLKLENGVEDFSELLCRLTFASSSLNYLYVYADSLVILRQPNCTFSNGTPFDIEELPKIENGSLSLEKTRVIDKTVLKFFPRISFLAIEYNEYEVIRSEIKKVDYLKISYFHQKLSSFKETCESTHELLITGITVYFSSVTDSFVLNLDKCKWLESFNINAISDQVKSIN